MYKRQHPNSSDPTRFGVVKFHRLVNSNGFFSGEIDALVEKPSTEVANDYRCNGYNYIIAGYYAFNSRIFTYIEKTPIGAKNEVQITDSISLGLADGEKVWGVVHAKKNNSILLPCEYWDVGIPEDYVDANRRLLNLSNEELASLE